MQKIKKINKKNKIFKINFTLLTIFVFMVVGYVAVINSITVKGYKIEEIESKIADLRSTAKDLSMDLSYKQSMNNVLASVDRLGLVESNNIDYISAPSTMVFNK